MTAAAAALVAAAVVAASPTPKIEQAMQTEVGYYLARDWPRLWATYTPRYRAACSHERWLRRAKASRDSLPAKPRLILRLLSASVHGSRAVVSYAWVYQGHATVVNGDVYRLIGGRWFDDLDAQGCR